MNVCRHNPEILALVEDAVEVVSMPNAAGVFVVQEDCGTIVRADLVERMPSESVIAHDLLVAQFFEGIPYTVEVSLELALRRLPPTFQQFLTIVGLNGRYYW